VDNAGAFPTAATTTAATTILLNSTHTTSMIGQGANGSDGKTVRTWAGTLRFVIAPLERAAMLGTRPAQPIGASGRQTASTGRIHDRSRPIAAAAKKPLPTGGRPYMTKTAVIASGAKQSTTRTGKHLCPAMTPAAVIASGANQSSARALRPPNDDTLLGSDPFWCRSGADLCRKTAQAIEIADF